MKQQQNRLCNMPGKLSKAAMKKITGGGGPVHGRGPAACYNSHFCLVTCPAADGFCMYQYNYYCYCA